MGVSVEGIGGLVVRQETPFEGPSAAVEARTGSDAYPSKGGAENRGSCTDEPPLMSVVLLRQPDIGPAGVVYRRYGDCPSGPGWRTPLSDDTPLTWAELNARGEVALLAERAAVLREAVAAIEDAMGGQPWTLAFLNGLDHAHEAVIKLLTSEVGQ